MAHHHILAVAAIVAVAQLLPCSTGYPWPVCGTNTTFTARSKYQANLNLAAATLPKNASASPALFATAAVGAAPDRLWAMGLCRGDADAVSCLDCLTQAFQDLQNDCSYDKDATIYYDACFLHYSGARLLSRADAGPPTEPYALPYQNNVTSDPARFNRVVAGLLNATAERAARSFARRFATGEADFDQEVPKVYSLAQCTPDQTAAQCRRCLAGIMATTLAADFQNYIRGRVLWINCTYRYETAPFFNGQAMVRLPSQSPAAPAPAPAPVAPATPRRPPPAGGGGRRRHGSVPGVVLVVVLPTLAALNIVACVYFRRWRRSEAQAKQPYATYSAEAEGIDIVDSMLMDVATLRAATGDFADSNKLGEGGFGAVYKGVLPDGEEVAVKRLSSSSTQGEEKLKNELALMAKLKHKNLVRLVGVCLEQQERLLVYEFVPNRSLDLILFDPERREQLDWKQRYKIINGIARGLKYLHEDSQLKVVHRNLKPSNILLDANMNPKISDFVLARIFGRGNYSVKLDAFGFGVMVLEIIAGRKNNGACRDGSGRPQDLLTAVWEHWEAGTASEMVDPSIMGDGSPEGDLLRCIHIGLLCVQGDPAARPAMSAVVMMLGGNTVTLQAPSKPGHSHGSPQQF